jgi:flagellar basal-body rod protein FlgG
MKNLQAIISQSVSNVTGQFDRLGQLSTDAANYSTYGYKSTRFENYLKEDGRVEGVMRTDYSVGSMFNTDRELDLGIDGAGFIPVTAKDGQTAYTRQGSFTVNKDGILSTVDGSIVADGIKIPANAKNIKIDPDGTVRAIMTSDAPDTVVGKIPLVLFNNPEKLNSIDGNKLLATKESGEPVLLKDHKSIKQKCLEMSNVNIRSTVSDVMRLNASLIASTRLMKYTDDLYKQAINLKQ